MQEHRGAFGADTFGVIAERIARFFGTPQYIIGQSIVVIAWVILNAFALAGRWDPYPFILLNLAFSLQAAYAAPLILLAQTRQADRDKHLEEGAERRQGARVAPSHPRFQVISEGGEIPHFVHRKFRLSPNRRLPGLVRLGTPETSLHVHELVSVGDHELRR